ncbi:Lipopolysaccharide-induced tumor necrosis factor-alpha factor [Orchesella cincta]|uniref:Lipopolysaccharide-induced tumor necrosis factor-alpha factor n=1 Tax=Orchesella cincta TaxID=48709 RepID=A0A1D2MMY8_ORCCI|nr:Lipopolysaccharide-induced tumor necrosis factor-alpha factor [Orchesella cincta]
MSAPPLYPDPSELPQKAYPPPYDAGMQQGAAPPPGLYYPPVQASPNLMMAGQPPQVVIPCYLPLGSHKASITCRHCQNEIQTNVDRKPSRVAWFYASCLCFAGCVCGCCLIPFCMDSCMDTHHACPNCGAHLGTYHGEWKMGFNWRG